MKHVYFIRPIGALGPVKIGCSDVPTRRLIHLSYWSPVHLEIAVFTPGDLKAERRVHAHFADIHSHHEWFNPDPRLTRFIESLKSGKSLGELIKLNGPTPKVGIRKPRVNRYTPERRKCLSYKARLRAALERLPRDGKCFAPKEIHDILENWNAATSLVPRMDGFVGELPTADEIKKIEALLMCPERHCVTLAQRTNPLIQDFGALNDNRDLTRRSA